MDALEMEDDLPAPMPPARAVDAGLPQRVARWLGGLWEARQIEGLMAWMQRYERALAWVAAHGDRDSAMLARRVLAGDWDDAWGLDYIGTLRSTKNRRDRHRSRYLGGAYCQRLVDQRATPFTFSTLRIPAMPSIPVMITQSASASSTGGGVSSRGTHPCACIQDHPQTKRG